MTFFCARLFAIAFFLVAINTVSTIAMVPIVGAGLAGLRAAQILRAHGLSPVIYEARHRVGGRVHSVEHDGVIVEHGGAFINSDHHALRALLTELTIATKHQRGVPVLYQFINHERSKGSANFVRFSSTLHAMDLDQKAINNGDTSRAQHLSAISLAHYLEEKNADEMLRVLLNLMVQNEFGVDLEDLAAVSLFDISLIDYDNQIFTLNGNLGDEAFVVDGGASRIAQALAKDVPIHFGHALTGIRQVAPSRYELTFATATEVKCVSCNKAIITAPLEVLKRDVAMDIGELPVHLKTFIATRKSGINSKIYVIFDKPFWRHDDKRFNLLTATFWLWDNGDTNHQFSLTAFFGGSSAIAMQTESDAKLVDEILTALSAFFPEARTHYLNHVRGHNWHNDPHARGSYTGARAPGEGEHRKARAIPCHDGLIFSGTSFCDDDEGFMNGAVIAGQEAAHLVLAEEW